MVHTYLFTESTPASRHQEHVAPVVAIASHAERDIAVSLILSLDQEPMGTKQEPMIHLFELRFGQVCNS